MNKISDKKTVLVTGASGMIGSALVLELSKAGYKVIGLDCRENNKARYEHIVVNLSDKEQLNSVFETYQIDRVIHLAALAHTAGESDLSYDRYYNINVVCASNVFEAAFFKNIPVLYISTADVYGFVEGIADANTPLKPVSVYGKTKALAEKEIKTLSEKFFTPYTVFRFAPVYTDEIKRDIQKRYYLKYPKLAYIVGGGTDYEFLYIDNAVRAMVDWIEKVPKNDIYNIKDEKVVNTAECIKNEKLAGKAKYVLHLPRWLVAFGFNTVKCLTGENKYTYLLNKAVNPLRTK